MKNQRMISGCGCEYCCDLAGVATVGRAGGPEPRGATIVSMQAYRESIERAVRVHGEYLSRRYGESFGPLAA
jgi:hypothetical protein